MRPPKDAMPLHLPVGPCVYFLTLRGEVVYVGASKNPATRIGRHIGRVDARGRPVEFDGISYVLTPIEKLREVEAEYVTAYKPRHNIADSGAGRPSKLPPGRRYTIRCVLVGREIEQLREALRKTGLSQLEFSRAAVLAAVAKIERGQPVG